MRRQDKEAVVAELQEAMGRPGNVILADYRGLTVKEMSELRTRLVGLRANLRVVKNNLLRRALSEEQQGLAEFLEGPTVVAFVADDAAPVLREMREFAKTHEELEFKGAWVEARVYGSADVAVLATIPPREQLLGMLVTALGAPLSQLVGMLQAVPRDLVLTLMALAEQREGAAASA